MHHTLYELCIVYINHNHTLYISTTSAYYYVHFTLETHCGPTDRPSKQPTDGPTDIPTCRAAIALKELVELMERSENKKRLSNFIK